MIRETDRKWSKWAFRTSSLTHQSVSFTPWTNGRLFCYNLKYRHNTTSTVCTIFTNSGNSRIFTLEERRLRGDLIETYKILSGKERVNSEDFFHYSQTGYNLRGHSYTLATNRCRLELRRNFSSQRVVKPWNKLPSHVVTAPSTNAFKNRFDLLKSGAL